MSEVLTPDLCIVGAGSAGLSVAAIAASFGVPVVLIERHRMGGDCLNVGCVPSKALIAAGDARHAMMTAQRFGIEAVDPGVDYGKLQRHIADVIARIAPNDSVQRYTAMGVRVIEGEAHFIDGSSLEVGGTVVRARRFVLATGSRPSAPPIPGLDGVRYFTNETIFQLDTKPEHLVVIGGGPIGVEIAQAHRRLGARVTVIEAAPRILAREDVEMSAVVEGSLLADGVEIKAGVAIERIDSLADAIGVALRVGTERMQIRASHLLVATGREPVTDGLRLEAAGVTVDQSGIVVDRGLRTANRRIYAIGDCAGGAAGSYRFTHVANYHAGLVIRSALFRLPVRVDTTSIARVTYTDPELAAVGLSEQEARVRYRSLRILRWPYAENDRAQAERATTGHVKAIVTPRGKILGCAIVGAMAGELILPWALALSRGLRVQDIAGLVFPYPTFSEVTKRAAVEFLRPSARNPWLRRLLGVARRFG